MFLAHRLVAKLPPGLRRLLKSLPGSRTLRDFLYHHPGGRRPSPGTLRPIVYLPTWLQWDVMKQRPQYVLQALARAGHPVWFVDPRASSRVEKESGVTIVPSLRPVPPADVIIYTHFAPTVSLVDRFENPVIIYDILDDLSIYDPDEEHLPDERRVRHHHPELVARADVVMVSNRVLAEKHRFERPDVLLIENGVALEMFDPEGDRHPDLPSGPVVGYHGAISLWFDFELVTAVARARPDLSFVLVGPVDERVAMGATSLGELPNVHLYPQQSVEAVVSFVRGFDVGIIPFAVNDMTSGVTPLKMFEYLAMTVPCVATPLPACVEHPVVATAGDAFQFATHIDSALRLTADQRTDLRARAEAASWDSRIEVLLERLDSRGWRITPGV